MNAVEDAYTVSIEREPEILEDLRLTQHEHEPGSEAWQALLKELREQQARTAELGHQLDVLYERRVESDPFRLALREYGDRLVEFFQEHRPDLFPSADSTEGEDHG